MSEPNQQAENPKRVSRRQILMTFGVALNAIAGILFAVPVVGYILGPAKRKEIKKELAWITLGPATQFPEGETRLALYRNPFVRPWDGDTGNIPCWVRRISADKFQVFAINCTHLGCPVRWFPQSGLFMCPCHGGAYYSDGARASGPPPRGLFEYDFKIEAGQLWIKGGQVPDTRLAAKPGMRGPTEEVLMRLIKDLGEWFDQRTQLGKPIREAMEHPVPRRSASWAYVFGSGAFVVMILQFITGICLAFVYVPSADQAWTSLQVLNHQQSFGWFIRALHGWGSNFMVALVLIHMVQVFVFGAYKFPRELTWIVGVFLLLMTLGMAFTGQVLRFDQDAYWGLGIGASVMGRMPLIGTPLVHSMLGGPIIAGETLSRFFAIHVFIVPGALVAFVGVHLLMVLKLGVNEWPMPGRVVKRDTYLKEYHELTHKDGVPFVPDAFKKDFVFSGLIILAVVVCAAFFGPFGPKGQPDPTVVQAVPKPDYFFLWMYAALALLPPNMETPLLIVGPVIIIGFLIALPLVSGTGEKSWRRRPVAMLSVMLIIIALAALTQLGTYAPWSPVMDAWSSDPIPPKLLEGRSALERQGALVLQDKQCRNCHALGGAGGQRGPALDTVATRLTGDELIRQVLQGRGNMPAYGNNLSPPETTALVAFLKSLHPAKDPPRTHHWRVSRPAGNSPQIQQGDSLMSPTAKAILGSWSFDTKMALGIIVLFILYVRGWLVVHRALPTRFPVWRLLAFVGGLGALWIAIASPLDAFSGLLLSAHMVQHLLLMSVVPPLMLLGAPLLPLLRGLPRRIARDGVGPFLVWPVLRRVGNVITHPVICWIAMAVSLCAWHVPPAFDLTLRSPAWHKVEHACFFATWLLFWWPVVRPFPSHPRWPLWSVPLYLLAADLLNTALSAILTFSDHVLYPHYLNVPRPFGTTALSDQSCAGVLMWVPGSLAFLVPGALIAIHTLSSGHSLVRPQTAGVPSIAPIVLPRPAVKKRSFDLLTVPVVGPFLRRQSTRRFMQAVLFVTAIAVIVDGLFGPQVSSMNLAGVLPWTYWRAFVIIGLLAAGNFFCMACPFMFFRELGRRLGFRQRPWPQALRSKWFGVALLVLFFWGYEVFGLWDKPIWTAWLIINYFWIALATDALFRGASFCKYVCPIGQFQFVASLVSPLEVKVRQADVCATCKTHDCLRGNQRQRGCEMDFHLPRKAGNLDCTFCLDCVRACPHDNIGIMAVAPGMDVVRDPARSSIGRFSRRLDVAALALVFVFAAFANAAFMTAPVVLVETHLAARLGLGSRTPVTGILLLISLLVIPGAFAFFAAHASRAASHVSVTARELFCRFSLSLVPLGAAMWAGHFLFHLAAGWDYGLTAIRRAANDTGLHLLKLPGGEPASPLLGADGVRVLQTLLLDAGFLLALYLVWRIAIGYAPRSRQALRLFAPWAAIATALYVAGVWIFLQAMQMRGLPGLVL